MISIQIIMRIQQLDYFLLKFDVKIDQYLNKYWHFDRNTHDFVKKGTLEIKMALSMCFSTTYISPWLVQFLK